MLRKSKRRNAAGFCRSISAHVWVKQIDGQSGCPAHLFEPTALSLDDIAQNLEMSKGPISQITRRLSDRNLIRKIWVPGDRKDYYEMTAELFENAFKNNFSLIQNNTKIARQLREKVEQTNDESLNVLKNRLVEMENFYQLMEKHFQNFLDEWVEKRSEIYQNQ
ncbi:MAG: MarR family transcriptional regulator [Calditrichia bacterium]